MGRKIVLTGVTLTDPDAPRLAVVDPIESSGSLLLIEPGHPHEPWDAGVPADESAIPNILSDTLSIGTAKFDTNGALTSTKGLLERSTKGGLHGIVSQSVSLTSGDGATIRIPTALNTYLGAHASNDYYVSGWYRLTRANNAVGSAWTYVIASGSGDSNVLANFSENAAIAATGLGLLGSRAGTNVIGAHMASGAVDGATTSTTSKAFGPVWGAPPTTFGNVNVATRNTHWPSFVFYRFYVEDLTVSGRTYAEVDAIDYAEYTRQVLTVGGRYYGDTTPTDPATIP